VLTLRLTSRRGRRRELLHRCTPYEPRSEPNESRADASLEISHKYRGTALRARSARRRRSGCTVSATATSPRVSSMRWFTLHKFGNASRHGYHNNEWAASMEKIGALPRPTSVGPATAIWLVPFGTPTHRLGCPPRRSRRKTGPPAFPGFPALDLVAAGAYRSRVQAAMAALRIVAPETGAYVNECDYFQPDWQKAFWGPTTRGSFKSSAVTTPMAYFSHTTASVARTGARTAFRGFVSAHFLGRHFRATKPSSVDQSESCHVLVLAKMRVDHHSRRLPPSEIKLTGPIPRFRC
jgi:hypothetical protein